MSFIWALFDLFEPLDFQSGSLNITVHLEEDAELILWNIGTNKIATIPFDKLNLPDGWKFVKHGKFDAYSGILVRESGKLTLSSVDGSRVRIDMVLTGRGAKVEASYNNELGKQVVKKGKHAMVLGESGYSRLIYKVLYILLAFFTSSILISLAMTSRWSTCAQLVRLSPIFLLLLYINVVWDVFLPGSFTGDAERFIRDAKSSGISDLMPPFYIILFKAYYYLFNGNLSGIILFHLYSFVFSLYFLISNIIDLLFEKKCIGKTVREVIVFICCLPILLNPTVIGFITLLYIDPVYVSLVLLSLGYFLRIARLGEGSLLLIILLFMAIILFRHNSIFLLPVLVPMFSYAAFKLVSKAKISVRLSILIPSLTLGFLVISLAAYSIINNTIVQKKSNYYIATPIYEVVGVVSNFKSLVKSDFSWMDSYMSVDKLVWRYGRHEAFIPVMYTANSRKELDLSAIYRDHAQLWLVYQGLLKKYPFEFFFIKMRHFSYALGVEDFHFSPFFSDRLNKAYSMGESVKEITDKGIYSVSKYGYVNKYLRENINQTQEGAAKFYLSSAIAPFIVCLLGIFAWMLLRLLGVNIGMSYSLWAVMALLNVTYMSSYVIFSHGAFVKYGFLTYILGLALIFPVVCVFVFNFASIAYSRTHRFLRSGSNL